MLANILPHHYVVSTDEHIDEHIINRSAIINGLNGMETIFCVILNRVMLTNWTYEQFNWTVPIKFQHYIRRNLNLISDLFITVATILLLRNDVIGF